LADSFVARHFGTRGAFRLHRNAIGWDLLRAPANVALAPVVLLMRLVSVVAYRAGLRRMAQALDASRFQFRSDVGAAVAKALLEEVVFRRPSYEGALSDDQLHLVRDYTSVRSAVSEISTMIAVIIIGLVAFHVVTPGALSLAPVIAERTAHAREIAEFPFGSFLGGAWYGMFPGERPVWHTVAVGAGLVLVFSVVTTFIGVIADPVQAYLGIHRRRLLRLLARIDGSDGAKPRLQGEFVLARGGDMADAAAMLLRLLKP
jgi:hypothetical protein